jgi:hypothetical protein
VLREKEREWIQEWVQEWGREGVGELVWTAIRTYVAARIEVQAARFKAGSGANKGAGAAIATLRAVWEKTRCAVVVTAVASKRYR